MTSKVRSVRRCCGAAWLIGMMSFAMLHAHPIAAANSGPEGALSAHSSEGTSADELFSQLLGHNHLREARLARYSAVRIYEIRNDKGKVHAKAVVRVEYRAPGAKTFRTSSEEGSWVVRHLVFKRLMESEVETAAGRGHQDSSIGPDNYALHVAGKEDVGGRECLVVDAAPRRKDKYLFAGRVWIDAQDFAVVKIVGRPARNPSFWFKRVDFIRQYQKIGDFWLPLKDESVTELRIHGKKILTIDHRDYKVNEAEATTDDRAVAGRDNPPATPRSQSQQQKFAGTASTGPHRIERPE